MKRWKWALLIFELVLFALILVLPQVALPDFAFHSGTAPVALKYRFSASPALAAVAINPVIQGISVHRLRVFIEDAPSVSPGTPHSRLSLLCMFLC